eukprot:6210045-Pleurochrysis_carterae.AAC.3
MVSSNGMKRQIDLSSSGSLRRTDELSKTHATGRRRRLVGYEQCAACSWQGYIVDDPMGRKAKPIPGQYACSHRSPTHGL